MRSKFVDALVSDMPSVYQVATRCIWFVQTNELLIWHDMTRAKIIQRQDNTHPKSQTSNHHTSRERVHQTHTPQHVPHSHCVDTNTIWVSELSIASVQTSENLHLYRGSCPTDPVSLPRTCLVSVIVPNGIAERGYDGILGIEEHRKRQFTMWKFMPMKLWVNREEIYNNIQ